MEHLQCLGSATINTCTLYKGITCYAGGTFNDLTISNDPDIAFGSLNTSNVIISGGIIKNTGTDKATDVIALNISNGGIYNMTIQANKQEDTTTPLNHSGNRNWCRLYNSAIASDMTLQSGGKLQINNGSAYNTIVKNGGMFMVYGNNAGFNTYAENTSVFGDGSTTYNAVGALISCYGGAAANIASMNSVYVGSGGYMVVGIGGQVTNVDIYNGGCVSVTSATGSNIVVYSGGSLHASAGAEIYVTSNPGAIITSNNGGIIHRV